MGARSEPVPQVVQAPADSVSALLGDVNELSQAIELIRRERSDEDVNELSQAIKLIRWEDFGFLNNLTRARAQGKQVAAEPSDHRTSIHTGNCLCGMPCHFSEKRELGGSEMDVKRQIASCKCVCRLLFLLSDSYLRLGRAYIEDGQFNLALGAVELACLPRQCKLLCLAVREKLLNLIDLCDPKAAEFDLRMRRLTPPPKEAFFPKGARFQSQASILMGDAYLEAQRTFDDSQVVVPHQEGEERMMSQEVEEEVYRVQRSCDCFFYTRVYTLFMLAEDYHLPRIVENKWEKNLLDAAECYSDALPLTDSSLDSEDSESEHTKYVGSQNERSEITKIAYRKLGFAWHECGRRLAELGWQAKDETDKYFRKAIEAFYRGNDLPNFELALCSPIEYHRKLAKFRETHQGPKGRIESIEEARVKHEEVLDQCRVAKNRLKKWGDGLHCKEVDTEEAHTYFELGILLMEKDKIYYDKQEKPIRKGRFSADQALQKAIISYRKVDCKPEVAFVQYQLGCVLRDRLQLESVKSDEYRVRGDIETIVDSWLKASEHYRAIGDTDMFLRIRMEHSDLHSAIPLKNGTIEGLDQALKQLLQGCGEVFNGSSMPEEYNLKLLLLLKTLCRDEKKKEEEKKKEKRRKKKNSNPMVVENLPRDIASSRSPSMAEMYGCALNKDYSLFYKKWRIYDSLTS